MTIKNGTKTFSSEENETDNSHSSSEESDTTETHVDSQNVHTAQESNEHNQVYWECLKCRGQLPPSRSGHTCTLYRERYMFVFGGFDGTTCFDDLYLLDLQTLVWRKIEAKVCCHFNVSVRFIES